MWGDECDDLIFQLGLRTEVGNIGQVSTLHRPEMHGGKRRSPKIGLVSYQHI